MGKMKRTTKEKEINSVLKKYDITIPPLCDRHVDSLYNLYINHDESAICKSFLNNGNYLNTIGFYYEEICKNELNMLKYYEMAIALGNSNAMFNLGCYYGEQNDIPNMVKYYEMAIAQGDSDAMNNLGEYYKEKKDIPNMVKYWEMAIEHGNIQTLKYYLSEILKDKGTIPYDKSKIEMFIRKVDMKEKMKLLKLCIKYAIHVQDEALFFHLYDTYGITQPRIGMKRPRSGMTSLTHPRMETTKLFETFHLFYMGRRPFVKIETCSLCMEEEKKIIPFDCFWHGYCMMCTLKLEKCAICKIPKNSHFAKMFDDLSEDKYSEDEYSEDE